MLVSFTINFYFRIVLDSDKYFNIVQSSCILHNHFLLLVFHIDMKQYWYIIIKWILYLDLCSFYHLSFFCSRIPLYHVAFNSHLSLTSLGCDGFLKLCLLLMTWKFWWVLVPYFVDCHPDGTCLIFFSWLDQSYGSLGRRPQR